MGEGVEEVGVAFLEGEKIRGGMVVGGIGMAERGGY